VSTIAYAVLTNRRDDAQPGTSSTAQAPGVKTYIDALAALVPAEALSLHAAIISLTTQVEGGVTTIAHPKVLAGAFWGLLVVAVVSYLAPRYLASKLDKLDVVRALIPPLAFVGWTMLQRATAFDAVCPKFDPMARSVLALFLAFILGVVAAALSYKADQKQP
jgi:hypothetical protein